MIITEYWQAKINVVQIEYDWEQIDMGLSYAKM